MDPLISNKDNVVDYSFAIPGKPIISKSENINISKSNIKSFKKSKGRNHQPHFSNSIPSRNVVPPGSRDKLDSSNQVRPIVRVDQDDKKRLLAGIKHMCATFEGIIPPKNLHLMNENQLQSVYDDLLSTLECKGSTMDKMIILLLKLIEKFLKNRNLIDLTGGCEILEQDPDFIQDLRIVCFKYLGARSLGTEMRLVMKLFATYATVHHLHKLANSVKDQNKIITNPRNRSEAKPELVRNQNKVLISKKRVLSKVKKTDLLSLSSLPV